MNDYAAMLISQYRSRGLLLDTNLLLVYAIGSYDRTLFARLSRLENYTDRDYDILARLIDQFEAIVTTPHILAEVSNLATNALHRNAHAPFLTILSAMMKVLVEDSAAGVEYCDKPLFIHFGVADTAIDHVARNKYLIVSDDLRFVARLESEGAAVLNFNHIRVTIR